MTGTLAQRQAVADGVAALGQRIEDASASFGTRVARDWVSLLEAGQAGARTCQLQRCADGWIACNLARPDDHELVPAWLALCGVTDVAQAEGAALIAAASLIGLPVALVGEREPDDDGGVSIAARRPVAGRSLRPRVVDLSSLWAGPLCGSVLAAAGCDVVKVESTTRPDALRIGNPTKFAALNSAKAHLRLDLGSPAAREALAQLTADADVVITSARHRALGSLGLAPEEHRGVWVSITGYGLASDRVAFGDDAAAAGGLVNWVDGKPEFVGDAIADPLSGLTAAAAALELLASEAAGIIDVAMAGVAAAHR